MGRDSNPVEPNRSMCCCTVCCLSPGFTQSPFSGEHDIVISGQLLPPGAADGVDRPRESHFLRRDSPLKPVRL